MKVEELKQLRDEGGFGGGDPPKAELYTLAESIGDAKQWVLCDMLEEEELEQARRDITEWKAKFLRLMEVDENWEPHNGDGRMGCY